ncbi:Cthe_2314 family HEPN domain-containing protein [Cohnella suwonensis]|uniref:Cthe_2314 family HEPN domain-containing protein n=1 Tax=Cohnella suwonensis TaxID=696072 RepID=A0ABW0LYW6_9BACL
MLRQLFGEEPRQWTGESLETVQAMERFVLLARGIAGKRPQQAQAYHTLAIWAEGLLRSMDELEQSIYAARKYAAQVRTDHVDELDAEERLLYYRHVYYDKNAYIRVFALLDKLGTLLNRLLGLQTEKIKAHFSYYTVLRHLRENGWHPEMTGRLTELKERHQDQMRRLRDRRNLEVHQMNAELRDDLSQRAAGIQSTRTLENLQANLADLDGSWSFAKGSLDASFRFACRWLAISNKA